MKARMRYKKKTRTVLMALALLACVACSNGPSDEVLRWAIGQQHSSIAIGVVTMKNYEITNHYNRDINGETIYTYDYTAKLQSTNLNGNFSLVKRGDKWYMY
jgi:ABC-type uncharacterized transport system YnjBCD substrate-binding protein